MARCRHEGERLEVHALLRGEQLPGGGRRRADCYAGLRELLRGLGGSVVGVDAPTALPEPMMRALAGPGGGWAEALREAALRFDSPEALRAWCRGVSARPELKRWTDLDARTPFSPYNLRLAAQTWGLMVGVLAPLVAEGACRVWPMQGAETGVPLVIEACPASALQRVGQRPPYKGRGRSQARAALLRCLVEATWGGPALRLSDADAEAAVADTGGDLLDALLCAWISAQPRPAGPLDPRCALEGFVCA